MKKSFIFLLALMPFLLGSFNKIVHAPVAAPNKLALIIAIGAYETTKTGWAELSSKNDVTIIKNSLLKIGFKEANISLLDDQKANKAGLLKALDDLAAKVKPGDMVVIHYSGHGHQIPDENGDELDKLDEALVAYGAYKTEALYKKAGLKLGSLHVSDDELGEKILKIREKLGKDGHLMVILDSCHSGTGTRGTEISRGSGEPLVPAGWKYEATKEEENGGFGVVNDAPKSRGAGDNLSKYVLISGASAKEENFETRDEKGVGYGSLSFCFSKAIVELGEKQTYSQLFAKIQSEMAVRAPRQSPQIEGDINYKIFAGDYVAQQPYFEIKKILSDTEFELNAGSLNGLNAGTKVTFEESGKSSVSATPLATGVISSASHVRARVKLDKPYTVANQKAVWVFPSELTFGDTTLRVSVGKIKSKEFQNALKLELAKNPLIEINEARPDLVIAEQPSRGNVSAVVQNKYLDALDEPISAPDVNNLTLECMKTIKNFMQGSLIKNLDIDDPSCKIEIRLIPLKPGGERAADTLDSKEFIKGGVLNLPDGSSAMFKLTNRGTKQAYFNIIDIQPNGLINPVVPVVGSDKDPRDFVLKGGVSIVWEGIIVEVGAPFGVEIYKVITSDQPLNLTPTIQLRGVGSRGSGSNPFEGVFGDTYNNVGSRGTKPKVMEEGARTGTTEYTFKIVPKK